MTTGLNQNLKKEKRWICWQARPKDNGKTDKIPMSPKSGTHQMDVTDFSKATTYKMAKATAEEYDLGVGILLGNGLSCIDLDDCIKEDGISDRANEIINRMNSYTEYSPSGLGLHIFYYGEKPGPRCRMKMENFEIEIYEKDRFITYTENRVYGEEVENRKEEITELYNEIFGVYIERDSKEYGTCTDATKKLRYALSHDKVLKKIWDGERDEDDESRNDLVIIGKLCYWLDRDPKMVYKAIQKSKYFKTKTDKHKEKFLSRYDNYFLPSFDKVNNELSEGAWDWQQTTILVGNNDDEVIKTGDGVKIDMKDFEDANKELLQDDDDEEVDYPWVYITDNGKTVILENIFSDWFLKKFKVMCINGVVYNEQGEIPDDYLVHKIQQYIKPITNKDLARTAKKLFEAVKNDAYKQLPRPKPNLVHIKKHTLDVNGETVNVLNPKFTINRLNVEWDEGAKCPQWNKFLSQLIEPEYVPILQEYMGYCLSPTNVAQMACFIVGNGGEGKSIVIQVLQKILGRNQFTSQIHKLSSNQFLVSNLENKLAFLDDDINLAALDDTSTFKQLVTNNGQMALERKNKQHHSAEIYAKILACGNGTLRSKYDKSDGFYRRLMVIKCKKKPEDRVDDKLLHVKILNETDGIFQWMLEGLQRLMSNGWYFSKSEAIDRNIEELKEEAENIRQFLNDKDYVVRSQIVDTQTGRPLTATMPEIYDCYCVWCNDNAYDAMTQRKVALFLSQHQGQYGIEQTTKVKRGKVYKRGYKYLHVKKGTEYKSGNLQLIYERK